MKKILSTLLVAAMLLSLVIVVAVPASAVDGIWDAMGTATQYAEDFEGIPNSRPGYEYTDDGLHMIPAKWASQSPFGTLQTKEKVDLKDGVYMLVRVDNFTYKADKWFNLNIWDSKNISPGTTTTGEGVQNLIRPGDAEEGKHSTSKGITWYTGGFTNAGTSNMAADAEMTDAEGRPLLALTVTWDGSSYAVDINGGAAPAAVIDYMNQKWGGNDSEAYIGFTLQNSNKDGIVEATILKFGTSKETASVPMGDDTKEPEEFNHTPVEIMDPDTVPEGQPAILMTGDRTNSHLMSAPSSATGSAVTVNDDFTVHVVASRNMADAGYWAVKYDVSYDIQDFPVCVTLTKNLCTCAEEDCYALESCNVYLCTGDTVQPDASCQITELDMSYDPIIVGEDSYLMFFCDMSADYAPFVASGRINGTRFDFHGIDMNTPGKNAFDLCFTAWFRNVDEATAYVNEYLGIEDDTTATTTETETETETETYEDTTVKAEDTTEKVEDTTEKKTEDKTEAKTEAPAENKGGCGSVVGFSAIAVIAMAAAGVVSFKKRH